MSAASEIGRILRLPVQEAPSQEWMDDFTRQVCAPSAWDRPGFKSLFPEQAFGMATYAHTGTLVGIIGAGGGKTLLEYACADIGWNEFGRRRILMLTKNGVYPQFVTQGREELKTMLGKTLPFVDLVGVYNTKHSKAKRMSLVRKNKAAIFQAPYSFLSQKWSEELLMEIQPDLVIADEAHALRNVVTAAGPPRLFRAMQAYQDRTGDRSHFLALSGTITERGLFDCWQLFRMAMGDRSPLPTEPTAAEKLGEHIDAGPRESIIITDVGESVLSWARENVPSDSENFYTNDQVGVRRAMQGRIVTAPGVVRSQAALAPAELQVLIHKGGYEPDENTKKYMDLISVGVAPNGDEIEFNLHAYKWRYEVTSGLYLDLYWDESKWDPEPLARAKEHHKLRNTYAKYQRNYLTYNRERGLDTPFLLQGHFARFQSGHEKTLRCDTDVYDAWLDMKEAEFPDMPTRDSRPVWFSDHRVLDVSAKVMELQEQGESTLVWCRHNVFRERIVEVLRYNNVNVVDVPSGNPQLLPKFPDKPAKPTCYVLMQKGYAEGINLQWGRHAIYGQWARAASLAEQTIARQHRHGNPHDEVFVHTFHSTEFDSQLLAATMVNAAYATQTLGTQQRLLVAAYDPPPIMYPRAALAERFENLADLDPAMEQELLRRYNA